MPLTPQGTLSGSVSIGTTVHGGVSPSSGTGTKNYNNLENKPSIEGVTLEGDKTFEELTLISITNSELETMIDIPAGEGYASLSALTPSEIDAIVV